MPSEESNAFSKRVRLRTAADFAAVYGCDYFAADDVLVIRAIRNGSAASRLGLSVSRKVGNAVVRNRWKRRIRESFRLQQDVIPPGLDLVVRPRKGGPCDFHRIKRSVLRLAQRLDRKMPPLPTGGSEGGQE